MIGQVFGRYEILEELGAGGMGVVYKARDTASKDLSRSRYCPRTRSSTRSCTRRFVREAKAASALNHPNIITIHEIERVPDGPDFITMELIEGETLRSLARRPLTFDSVARIGHQVAEALAVAHAAGIVHGDVKSENIMVRRDGYVKLLDFGLARLFEPDSASGLTTQSLSESMSGMLHGTPAYMSPEQAREQNVTEGTDIIALGLILYELIAGRHPFPSGSPIAVLSAILTEAPLPPSRLQPEIPRPLEDLILRMLEKNPADRPAASTVVEVLVNRERGKLAGRLGLPGPACRPLIVGHERERLELRALFSELR